MYIITEHSSELVRVFTTTSLEKAMNLCYYLLKEYDEDITGDEIADWIYSNGVLWKFMEASPDGEFPITLQIHGPNKIKENNRYMESIHKKVKDDLKLNSKKKIKFKLKVFNPGSTDGFDLDSRWIDLPDTMPTQLLLKGEN